MNFMDFVSGDININALKNYDISDCYRLSNLTMKESANAFIMGNKVLSDDFMRLSRDFVTLSIKYEKILSSEREYLTEHITQHIFNKRSNIEGTDINLNQYNIEKDELQKEFNSLISRYIILGDFSE